MAYGLSPALPSRSLQLGLQDSRLQETGQRSRSRGMVHHNHVYWCVSHQKPVEPNAQRELREKLHCKIVKLNLEFILLSQFTVKKSSRGNDTSNQILSERVGLIPHPS